MMTKLLHLEASPRKARSHSSAVADAYLAARRAKDPKLEVDHLDLWAEQLPEFDGGALQAKHAYRLTGDALASNADRQVWNAVTAVFERFAAADAYLISTPMWNFSVPYKLKQYFDVMAQPGLTFSLSSDGLPKGHLSGRSAIIVASRGGAYGGESPIAAMDHQTPWLETMLRFIGVDDIRTVLVEPTIGTQDSVAAHRAAAIAEAEALGQTLPAAA